MPCVPTPLATRGAPPASRAGRPADCPARRQTAAPAQAGRHWVDRPWVPGAAWLLARGRQEADCRPVLPRAGPAIRPADASRRRRRLRPARRPAPTLLGPPAAGHRRRPRHLPCLSPQSRPCPAPPTPMPSPPNVAAALPPRRAPRRHPPPCLGPCPAAVLPPRLPLRRLLRGRRAWCSTSAPPRPVPTCPSSRPRRVRCNPCVPASGALSSPACTPRRRHTPAPAPCRSPALLRPPRRRHAPPRPLVRASFRPPPPARLLRPRAPPTGAPPAPPHPLPLPPPTRTTWPQAYQARRGTTGGVERRSRRRSVHRCSGTRRWGCTALLSRGLPPRCPYWTATAPPSCAGTAPEPGLRRCRLPASPAPVCRSR